MLKLLLKEFDTVMVSSQKSDDIFNESIQRLKLTWLGLGYIMDIIRDNVGNDILFEPDKLFFETKYRYFYDICERHIRTIFDLSQLFKIKDDIVRKKIFNAMCDVEPGLLEKNPKTKLFSDIECNPLKDWGII